MLREEYQKIPHTVTSYLSFQWIHVCLFDTATSALITKSFTVSFIAMSSNNSKTPPPLSHSKSYEDLLKLLWIWPMYTELPEMRQGPA